MKEQKIALVGGGRSGTKIFQMYIECLKELEQYHAIGTVEECEDAVKNIESFYQLGYNKAIDDFAETLNQDVMAKTFGLRICDVDRIAEQLKKNANSVT